MVNVDLWKTAGSKLFSCLVSIIPREGEAEEHNFSYFFIELRRMNEVERYSCVFCFSRIWKI